MNDGYDVNDQIVNSVADVVILSSGLAPAQAFGMLDTAMAETLAMTMHNAVSRQQGGSTIGSAATTATCARMLSVPAPAAAVPSSIPPIPVPSPMAPLIEIAEQTAFANSAIVMLQATAAAAPSIAQEMAMASLVLLRNKIEATPNLPPPPPAPPHTKSPGKEK